MIADDVGINWVMAAWVTLTTYMLTIPSSVTTAFFCPEIKGTRHNCLGILKTKCTNGTAEQTTFIPQKTVLKNLQVHVTYFWVSFLRRKDEKFGFYRCSWLLLSENLFTCFSSHLIQLEWFLTISHDRLPSSGVTKFSFLLHPYQINLHFTLKASGQKLRFDAWHLQYIKDNWQDWYIVNENINKCRNCQVVDSDYSSL